MKAYRIKNWEKHFENNRSRTVSKLSWVPVPNSHDGEGFAVVMSHKDAAEIFSAWILILQVASRCQSRGILVREGGKPHDSASLSLRTRAQVKWFEKAIPVLVEIGWIEEFAVECHDSDSAVTPACQPSDEERKKEGTELHADCFRFADWFRTLLPADFKLQSGWRDSWAQCFDEMLRIDSRSKEEIREVCQWARKDEFWSSNFLSPLKLRKRNDGVQYFDTFLSKCRNGTKPIIKQTISIHGQPCREV